MENRLVESESGRWEGEDQMGNQLGERGRKIGEGDGRTEEKEELARHIANPKSLPSLSLPSIASVTRRVSFV